jgi:hypothetical protein
LVLPALNVTVPLNQHSLAQVLAFSPHMHQPECAFNIVRKNSIQLGTHPKNAQLLTIIL